VTLLAEVARVSAAVAATASRLEKTRLLAECLRVLEPGEVEIALPYLSGEIRQGRLALGYAALKSAIGNAAPAAGLSVRDVDSAFERLKLVKGRGAASLRQAELRNLVAKATAQEQDFLLRLIAGELRQGALEGVMLEAIAAAANLPAAEVRRAATFAGAISMIANMAQWAMIFGGGSRSDDREGGNPLGALAMIIVAPIAAMMIQMAISRSREYLADEGGARIAGNPLSLASALRSSPTATIKATACCCSLLLGSAATC